MMAAATARLLGRRACSNRHAFTTLIKTSESRTFSKANVFRARYFSSTINASTAATLDSDDDVQRLSTTRIRIEDVSDDKLEEMGEYESESTPAPSESSSQETDTSIRLVKLLSHPSAVSVPGTEPLSRRAAERAIRTGKVMIGRDQFLTGPSTWMHLNDLAQNDTKTNGLVPTKIKFDGKPVLADLAQLKDEVMGVSKTVPKVWAVHKMNGELVADFDPDNRPLMMTRLKRGGVGSGTQHLKPVGRLDMSSEGLILVTTDGNYARELELPGNRVHRTYRARVHGRITDHKLRQIRQGRVQMLPKEKPREQKPSLDGLNRRQRRRQRVKGPDLSVTDVYETNERPTQRYGPMAVEIEGSKRNRNGRSKSRRREDEENEFSSNTWLRVTATEGKNRQIRNAFQALGLTVTRLIRISYGDYTLDTIPKGMAIPVPYKPVDRQRRKGPLVKRGRPPKEKEPSASPITWVKGGRL